MIDVTYPIINGCTYIQIVADTLEEVQEAIDRHHGRADIQGPEKWGDKYKALGKMGP